MRSSAFAWLGFLVQVVDLQGLAAAGLCPCRGENLLQTCLPLLLQGQASNTSGLAFVRVNGLRMPDTLLGSGTLSDVGITSLGASLPLLQQVAS
jgi:hypothetical protein